EGLRGASSRPLRVPDCLQKALKVRARSQHDLGISGLAGRPDDADFCASGSLALPSLVGADPADQQGVAQPEEDQGKSGGADTPEEERGCDDGGSSEPYHRGWNGTADAQYAQDEQADRADSHTPAEVHLLLTGVVDHPPSHGEQRASEICTDTYEVGRPGWVMEGCDGVFEGKPAVCEVDSHQGGSDGDSQCSAKRAHYTRAADGALFDREPEDVKAG